MNRPHGKRPSRVLRAQSWRPDRGGGGSGKPKRRTATVPRARNVRAPALQLHRAPWHGHPARGPQAESLCHRSGWGICCANIDSPGALPAQALALSPRERAPPARCPQREARRVRGRRMGAGPLARHGPRPQSPHPLHRACGSRGAPSPGGRGPTYMKHRGTGIVPMVHRLEACATGPGGTFLCARIHSDVPAAGRGDTPGGAAAASNSSTLAQVWNLLVGRQHTARVAVAGDGAPPKRCPSACSATASSTVARASYPGSTGWKPVPQVRVGHLLCEHR